jgi:hypothetical protein
MGIFAKEMNMINIGKDSNLVSAEVVNRAIDYFGPAGIGLKIVDQGACCVRFEGSGGHVFVQTADIDNKDGSQVTVQGREWEHQIKQFMGKI